MENLKKTLEWMRTDRKMWTAGPMVGFAVFSKIAFQNPSIPKMIPLSTTLAFVAAAFPYFERHLEVLIRLALQASVVLAVMIFISPGKRVSPFDILTWFPVVTCAGFFLDIYATPKVAKALKIILCSSQGSDCLDAEQGHLLENTQHGPVEVPNRTELDSIGPRRLHQENTEQPILAGERHPDATTRQFGHESVDSSQTNYFRDNSSFSSSDIRFTTGQMDQDSLGVNHSRDDQQGDEESSESISLKSDRTHKTSLSLKGLVSTANGDLRSLSVLSQEPMNLIQDGLRRHLDPWNWQLIPPPLLNSVDAPDDTEATTFLSKAPSEHPHGNPTHGMLPVSKEVFPWNDLPRTASWKIGKSSTG